MPSQRDSAVVRRFRTGMLAIFVFGAAGAWVELILLGHFEDLPQWTPVALLPAGLLVLAWQRFDRGRLSTQVFQVLMAAYLASGLVGLWFHYSGNAEFELEMYPSLSGWSLVREALSGATPALAPGTMIHLGLLGLMYTYRHPFLASGDPREQKGE